MNKKNSSLLESPCVRNCCLNLEDVCLGCGRHLSEITGWQPASIEQKQKIISLAKERLEKNA